MANDSELAALRAGLGDTSWLLGGRRRRLAAQQLAALGAPDAAQALAEEFVARTDDRVVEIAHRALAELTDPPAIDAVCDVLVTTGDEQLDTLVTTAGYTHSDPAQRALLLFLGGEFDRYAELDVDGHFLAAAHATAKTLAAQGFDLVDEQTERDGTVRLVLRRVAKSGSYPCRADGRNRQEVTPPQKSRSTACGSCSPVSRLTVTSTPCCRWPGRRSRPVMT